MTDAPGRGAPTAVADFARGTIVATVEIAASAERVFRALSSDEVARWWGSGDTYRVTKWTADFRRGGSWRTEGVGKDGRPFSVGGEIVEIDRPRKLVQTWQPDWDDRAVTTVSYELEDVPGGTRLTVRHEGFQGRPDSCRDHASGWERVLGWLRAYVASPTPQTTAGHL
jgi:uncharacterized protein YndB with AHSA1/START domain